MQRPDGRVRRPARRGLRRGQDQVAARRRLLGEALLFGQALFFRDPSFLGRLLGSDAGFFLGLGLGLGLGLEPGLLGLAGLFGQTRLLGLAGLFGQARLLGLASFLGEPFLLRLLLRSDACGLLLGGDACLFFRFRFGLGFSLRGEARGLGVARLLLLLRALRRGGLLALQSFLFPRRGLGGGLLGRGLGRRRRRLALGRLAPRRRVRRRALLASPLRGLRPAALLPCSCFLAAPLLLCSDRLAVLLRRCLAPLRVAPASLALAPLSNLGESPLVPSKQDHACLPPSRPEGPRSGKLF